MRVSAGCQMALGQLLDLPLAEALDQAELEPFRPALGRGLDRRHEGLLASGAPAAFAARPLAAEIGVVDLDPAFELGLLGLACRHRPHQLVLHQPGGLPLDPGWRRTVASSDGSARRLACSAVTRWRSP